MSKLQWILLLIGSNIPIAVQLLRKKDADSEGSDDLAADILEYAGEALHAIQFNLPIPDLPPSLRPKVDIGDEASEIDDA